MKIATWTVIVSVIIIGAYFYVQHRSISNPSTQSVPDEIREQSNKNQQIGSDNATQANIGNLGPLAQLYFSDRNSYVGFCSSDDSLIANIKTRLQDFVCHDSVTAYAVSARTTSGQYFCADSTGKRGTLNSKITGTSCQ